MTTRDTTEPMPGPAPGPSPRAAPPTLASRAAEIVDAIAERLADPEHVAAVTTASARDNAAAGGEYTDLWTPAGLTDGNAGVAQLYAELGRGGDRAARTRTHAHVSAAVRDGAEAPGMGLYRGAAAIAYAAHRAGLGTGDFATLSGQLDPIVAEDATLTADQGLAGLRAGEPITSWRYYDVIVGTSGIGRLLLARHAHTGDERATAALRAILELLVTAATRGDVDAGGLTVPSWWSTENHLGLPDAPGHLNLGLAHGIGGPLALLSLAWSAGVHVPGQAEAIAAIVGLLRSWASTDEYGPYWAYCATTDVVRGWWAEPHHRVRDAWCYGALGLARALQLAGDALDRTDWTALAVDAARGSIAAAGRGFVFDHSLCHGWAGILRIVQRMAADTADPVLDEALPALTGHLLDGFDPDAPFGYRYVIRNFPLGADRPGYLEGAAGIALALHSVATGERPATDPADTAWDAALLIA
jgi:lantibiotic biosynthesis protein